MRLTPTLNRQTLAEQIARALLDGIHVNKLAPGDTLPSTAELASEFGVSRSVIREALKTLEGQEAIEITNGRNAVVKAVTSASLFQFFQRAIPDRQRLTIEVLEVRRGLEIQTAYLAALRHEPAEIDQLETLIREMKAKLDDPEAYAELDLQFHLSLASITRNSLLYYLVESIRNVLKDTIQEGLRSRLDAQAMIRVQSLHEDLLTELKNGDGDGASRAMALHFDDAINAIIYSIDQDTYLAD